MKRLDIILMAAVLLITGLLFALMNLLQDSNENTQLFVEIYINGKLSERIRLPNEEKEIEIRTDNGYNIIKLMPKSVSIIDADCPTHDCVHSPALTRSGATTACLPHKLLLRLLGGAEDSGEGEVDIIAG